MQNNKEELKRAWRLFWGIAPEHSLKSRKGYDIEDFWLEKLDQEIAFYKEGLVERIKKLRKERPTRPITAIVDALRKEESMTEKEKHQIWSKDNGFYIENVEYVVYEQVIDEALSLITSQEEGVK